MTVQRAEEILVHIKAGWLTTEDEEAGRKTVSTFRLEMHCKKVIALGYDPLEEHHNLSYKSPQ